MDVIPELSVNGFITNKVIMMYKLYEYFLTSHHSQSNDFIGRVGSLKYILSEAKDSNQLRDMCINTLEMMYSTLFKSVVVDVIINDTSSVMRITVNVNTVDYSGKSYTLSEVLAVTDNNVINYNKLQESFYVW